jgi:LPXTG-motif cell wall-anchored protein
VPSAARRIFLLLVVACLGAAVPVTFALAQDAGDQQYQDPFGGSGTSTTKGSTKTTPNAQTTPSGNLQPLSPSPQSTGTGSTGSSGSSGTTTPSTSAAPAPAAAGQGLPNTGADARMLLLAGGALLLIGLGLRLRSAPERF